MAFGIRSGSTSPVCVQYPRFNPPGAARKQKKEEEERLILYRGKRCCGTNPKQDAHILVTAQRAQSRKRYSNLHAYLLLIVQWELRGTTAGRRAPDKNVLFDRNHTMHGLAKRLCDSPWARAVVCDMPFRIRRSYRCMVRATSVPTSWERSHLTFALTGAVQPAYVTLGGVN